MFFCLWINLTIAQPNSFTQDKPNHYQPPAFTVLLVNSANAQIVFEISNDNIKWVKYKIKANISVYYEMKKHKDGNEVIPVNTFVRLNFNNNNIIQLFEQKTYQLNKKNEGWIIKEIKW